MLVVDLGRTVHFLKNSLQLSQDIQNTLAEKVIEFIPCAERVIFVLSGSDATTAAIRLARKKRLTSPRGSFNLILLGSAHRFPGCGCPSTIAVAEFLNPSNTHSAAAAASTWPYLPSDRQR
jgi:hypothetical protein